MAEIYALSEAVRDMNLRLWIAGEMGIQIEWPGRIFVDNAAWVSFQHGTNPNLYPDEYCILYTLIWILRVW